jgi:hypothetical protein
MKKIFLMAFTAAALVACDSNRDTNRNTTLDTTTETRTSTSDNAAYSASDGDVTRRDGRVLTYRNGQWVETTEDVRNDKVVVTRNGRVIRDGNERELREGETVNRTGEFFDRTGRAIENAWDDTKAGVRKLGDKIEDAVDGDNRNRR